MGVYGGGGPHLLREKGFEPGRVEREACVFFGGQGGERSHALSPLLLSIQPEGRGGRRTRQLSPFFGRCVSFLRYFSASDLSVQVCI